MRLIALIGVFLALTFSAFAQESDGPPNSPYVKSQHGNAINAMKIRLGPPVITAGPGQIIGDTAPVFTTNPSGGFYFDSANQLNWFNCVATLLTNIGTGAAGLNNSCSGSATTNSQTVYLKTTTPTQTSTVQSSFSIGLPAGSITAISPAVANDACGDWPQASYPYGGFWYIYVHNEGPCDYPDPLGTLTATVTLAASSGASSFGVKTTPALSAGMAPFNGSGGLQGTIQTIGTQSVTTITCTLNTTVTMTGCSGAGLSTVAVGMYANGTNIPSNDVITAIVGSTITLTSAATGAGSTSVAVSTIWVTMTSALTQNLSAGQQIVFNQLGFTNESSSMWKCTSALITSCTPMAVGGISPGTIISSQEPVEPGWLTGIGDCTMIPDDTGPTFMYAYCSFYSDSAISDYHNLVGHAPIATLGPTNWTLMYGGCWCAPGLNNPYTAATKLPNADLQKWIGSSAATMSTAAATSPYKALITDGKNHAYNIPTQENYNGIALSVSLDYLNFTTLHSPILNYDFQNFNNRPTTDDLYLYSILRSDTDGGSVIAPTHFALWNVMVYPNNSLASRYYVQAPAAMSIMSAAEITAGTPQMGVMLGLWGNTSTGNPYSGFKRATTVNPYGSDQTDAATETGWGGLASLGYLMTSCPGSVTINNCDANGAQISNRIEECLSNSSDDHQLHIDTNGTTGSCPSGWTHVRTVGWVYKSPPPFASKPVYACTNASPSYHFASNDNTCGGQTLLGLLGYALAS